MNHIQENIITRWGIKVFLLAFVYLLTNQMALAASISFRANSDYIQKGDEVLIEVMIDTEGEEINVVEGLFHLDSSVGIININNGNSIFPMWVEGIQQEHVFQFSGMIPGGFSGKGKIFSAIVSPTKIGKFFIEISSSTIYLNDGKGTHEKIPSYTGYFYTYEENLRAPEKVSFSDVAPPEDFTAEIIEHDGVYMVIFSATDKESGIASYSVTEGDHVFEDVNSPFILNNQNIDEIIKVTATDHSNNKRIVTVSYYSDMYSYIAVGVFVLLIVALIVWRKKIFRTLEKRHS